MKKFLTVVVVSVAVFSFGLVWAGGDKVGVAIIKIAAPRNVSPGDPLPAKIQFHPPDARVKRVFHRICNRRNADYCGPEQSRATGTALCKFEGVGLISYSNCEIGRAGGTIPMRIFFWLEMEDGSISNEVYTDVN